MPRPDQSFYLAHFTKDGREFRGNEIDNPTIDQMSARQRLINILTQKEILAANLNWVNKKAVCFTVHGEVCCGMLKNIVHMGLDLQKN